MFAFELGDQSGNRPHDFQGFVFVAKDAVNSLQVQIFKGSELVSVPVDESDSLTVRIKDTFHLVQQIAFTEERPGPGIGLFGAAVILTRVDKGRLGLRVANSRGRNRAATTSGSWLRGGMQRAEQAS